MADESKLKTVLLGLSLVVGASAFVVSMSSLSESRRNRIVIEDVNRPLLKADGFRAGSSWDVKDRITFRLLFLVKNVGKGTAVIHSLTDAPIQAEVFNESEDCKLIGVQDQYAIQSFDLLPENHVGISVTAVVSRGCEKRRELKFPLTIALAYSNKATGKTYDPQVLVQTVTLKPKDEKATAANWKSR